MNKFKRLASMLAVAAAFAAPSAQAALVSCFGGNSLVDTAIADCLSFASVPNAGGIPSNQSAGVATTVGGSFGNMDLDMFSGGTPTSLSNDILLGSATQIQYGGLISTANYLVLIYETGGAPREWNVVGVTGAELMAGFGYGENITTGTVKFEIYTDPRTTPPLPEPASLALVGLGLVGLGMSRRRRA